MSLGGGYIVRCMPRLSVLGLCCEQIHPNIADVTKHVCQYPVRHISNWIVSNSSVVIKPQSFRSHTGVCKCEEDFFGADCSGNKTEPAVIDVPDQPMTCDPATSATTCSIVRITGVFIDDPSLLCRFNEMKVLCSGCLVPLLILLLPDI